MFPLQPQLIPVSSLHHTPHSALEQHFATKLSKHPPRGCQTPHVTQESPRLVFCRKDTQAPDTSHLCRDSEDLGRSKYHLNLALPPISHSSKALIPASVPKFASKKTAEGSCLCSTRPTRTCEDGLVDPQGGGADFDDPNVRWHLVTHCKDKSRAALSGGTGSTQRPRNGDSKPQTDTNHVQVHSSTQPGATRGPAPGKGPCTGIPHFCI